MRDRSFFGGRHVVGTITGVGISSSFSGSVGQVVTIIYSGTLENGTMKGKVAFGDVGEATFTGKKK